MVENLQDELHQLENKQPKVSWELEDEKLLKTFSKCLKDGIKSNNI